jgi:RNA polymerase sigma-70 factor (ECF subfamily)
MPDSRRNVVADEDIVVLMVQNPQQAMPLIVGKYGETLFGVLLRMTGERELAEDLLQDSMVKVWKNASSYNAERGRLFTWLIGIARNTAIDYLRVQKNQQQRQSVSLDSPVYSERIGSLADEGYASIDSGLAETIQKLDDKYRQIIDLLYLQGYTQQQATDILGIPLGTVKTRAQAAIRELRKLLGDADFAVLLVLDQWLRSL